MTKEISLTRGKVAIVSDEDYEEVSRYKWSAVHSHDHWYAIRSTPRGQGKRTTVLMHRQITKSQEGQQVDHIDGDGLNNQRSNLRLCTHAQNKQNSKVYSNNSSGYKGVRHNRDREEWNASVVVNKKKIHLGGFATAEDAARAYDDAALKYHGEFARTNFNEPAKTA